MPFRNFRKRSVSERLERRIADPDRRRDHVTLGRLHEYRYFHWFVVGEAATATLEFESVPVSADVLVDLHYQVFAPRVPRVVFVQTIARGSEILLLRELIWDISYDLASSDIETERRHLLSFPPPPLDPVRDQEGVVSRFVYPAVSGCA